jgi:hypothetical protein
MWSGGLQHEQDGASHPRALPLRMSYNQDGSRALAKHVDLLAPHWRLRATVVAHTAESSVWRLRHGRSRVLHVAANSMTMSKVLMVPGRRIGRNRGDCNRGDQEGNAGRHRLHCIKSQDHDPPIGSATSATSDRRSSEAGCLRAGQARTPKGWRRIPPPGCTAQRSQRSLRSLISRLKMTLPSSPLGCALIFERHALQFRRQCVAMTVPPPPNLKSIPASTAE